ARRPHAPDPQDVSGDRTSGFETASRCDRAAQRSEADAGRLARTDEAGSEAARVDEGAEAEGDSEAAAAASRADDSDFAQEAGGQRESEIRVIEKSRAASHRIRQAGAQTCRAYRSHDSHRTPRLIVNDERDDARP